MIAKVKKSLSLQLRKQGFTPLSTDVDYDTYKMDKPIGAYIKNFDKSEYIVMGGLSFTTYKEVK